MRILALEIDGFRSYQRHRLVFDATADVHVLLGDNGSGKTNILEAISYLAQGRSCLGIAPDVALRWQSLFFRLRADLGADDATNHSLEFVFQSLPERASACFVQDVKVPYLRFIGHLPSVVFLPQDLDLFTGSPSRRRAFLDALLAQLQKDFVLDRMRLERVLKQRNSLLKRIGAGEVPMTDLEPWDRAFAVSGAAVHIARTRLLADMFQHLPLAVHSLGESWSELSLVPHSCTIGRAESDVEQQILGVLFDRRQKDVAAGCTTAGPHRDDWSLTVDGHSVGLVGSRGQQRTAFLGLLFVAVNLLTERLHERPVVLLDDVFSELDPAHQCALLEHCRGHQTIMTTSQHPASLRDAIVYDVVRGTVTPRRHIPA